VAQAADIDQYMPLVHGLLLHGTSLLLMDGTAAQTTDTVPLHGRCNKPAASIKNVLKCNKNVRHVSVTATRFTAGL